jgi:GNAT superfamily N-acetyltransferase
MSDIFEISVLSAEDIGRHIGDLSEVLVNCVHGGAGVSFMLPFGIEDAEKFWRETAEDCETGDRMVLAALMSSAVVGSVQLVPVRKPNQPHRAEITKLLVHRKARRRGIARALMLRVEEEAKRFKRSLLCFDTTTGNAAEKLYLSLDYVRAGLFPATLSVPTGFLPTRQFFTRH